MQQPLSPSAIRRALRRVVPAGLSLVCTLAIPIVLPAIGGCKKQAKVTASTQPAAGAGAAATEPVGTATVTGELSGSLAALYDHAVPPASFSYMGIKLGDPESSINKPDITSGPDASGWIGYKQHENTFRVENGKVKEMQITEPSVLSTLGLTSDSTIVERFGKPDQMIDDASEVRYVFGGRWLTILWNRTNSTPKAVLITSDAAKQ